MSLASHKLKEVDMLDQSRPGIGLLLGLTDTPEKPIINPRRAALRRLKEALKSDHDDDLEEAFSDALQIMNMDE